MNNDDQGGVNDSQAASSPGAAARADRMVVGIGASAGGLAALKAFLSAMPPNSGLVFVVVVHLAPDHKSHLADLLQPHTRFPVEQVMETTALEPDHVYVIPPNANLNTIDSHLRLSGLEEQRNKRAPIDHFFRTLANTYDGHSVGVVLTGTGSDGTLGIREIKERGGLVVVQDPSDAEYDGMPQSAIATGLADLILPVAEIPGAILRYARTVPRVMVPEEGAEVDQSEQALLEKIFAQLRARTDRDFSRYKSSTMLRRVARRMQLNYIEDLPGYLEKLRQNPEEVRALADDLLITVTNFFRDPEVFEKLEKEVIPELFERRGPKDSVRVWSAGCATGEEAYSLAMLLLEECRRREMPPGIQLFASDLHTRSLEKAREGFYPGDIETDLSAERLKRFFSKENGCYRIRKELREMVVFAPHNLLGDPPFSRLDLISCRNLLIYLDRSVQRAVIELFHYSLSPGGFLVLGSAETVEASDLFLPEDKKLCIYRKRNVPAVGPRLPVFPLSRIRLPGQSYFNALESTEPLAYGNLHHRLVERYAPPSLLISADNKLVHLSEHAGRYLVHPGGQPTENIFMLVREELRAELQSLLQKAREKKQASDSQPVAVRFNGHTVPVVMHVGPGLEPQQEGFALVIFEEREAENQEDTGSSVSTARLDMSDRALNLENELAVARQRLRAVVDEYETSQEEMKASNEEMQSANEELRSTMEELETSKEELQSINEELQTVNQENRHKVEELAQLSSDLHNLLSATGIATLFLDRDLRIMRFNPKVSELFNVRITDRGRPISDLTHRLGYSELQEDAQTALDSVSLIEREVQDDAGRWYLTRVLPYRGTDERIEGVVITFVDISRRVAAEAALRGSEKQLSAELDSMQHLHDLVASLLVSADLETALETVLDSAIQIMGVTMGSIQMLNQSAETMEVVAHRGFGQAYLERFRYVPVENTSLFGRAVNLGERVVVVDVHADDLDDADKAMAATAGYQAVQSTPLISRDGRVLGILSTYAAEPHQPAERDLRILDLFTRQAADFVDRCRAQDELRHSEERYRLLIENAREYAILMVDLNGSIATWNPGAQRIFGYTGQEILGRAYSTLFTEEDRAAGVPEAEIMTAQQEGRSADDRWYARKDGSRFWAGGVVEVLDSDGDALRGFVKVLRDNSERKKSEESLRSQESSLLTANEALSRANSNLKQFAFAASHDLREPLRTISAYTKMLVDSKRSGDERATARAAHFIVEGTDRMGQLLADLLAYTQLTIDEDRFVEPVDLNLVLEKTLESLKLVIEQSGALVTCDHLPVVLGRESYYSQLFQNLLTNAVKYRADRPLTIHISGARLGNEWRLGVIDNGIGIERVYQEQIFGVFKRLHGKKIPGTGIGLAICRCVVERFGGRIWVESVVEQGSTFWMTIPVAEELGKGATG